MKPFVQKFHAALQTAGNRFGEQIRNHFVTFFLFLLVATLSFTWFMTRGHYHTVSFFHGRQQDPPVAGIVFADGRVPDFDELVIVSLETPGRKIAEDPEAVGAFFFVMDAGEEMPEFKRFLSPFVHGLTDWDGTPEDFAARADRLPATLLDRNGSRLLGYFEIGEGSSADEVRKFGMRARSTFAGKGNALVVIPALVPWLYRDQVFGLGGILLTAGTVLLFGVLLLVTRNLKYAFSMAFVPAVVVLWSGGVVSRFGPPLTFEMLTLIPVLYAASLWLILRFRAGFDHAVRTLPADTPEKDRFALLLGRPFRELLLFWLPVLPAAAALLFFAPPVRAAALFLAAGTLFTAVLTLLAPPLAAFKSADVSAKAPRLKFPALRPWFWAVVILAAGWGVSLFTAGGNRLLAPGPETADFMAWFSASSGLEGISLAGVLTPASVVATLLALALSVTLSVILIPNQHKGDSDV